jgi:uncharacterized protein (TIGR03067 family)
MRRVLLLLTVLPLGFAPAPAPRSTNAADLKALQGEWVLVSETRQGEPRVPGKARLEFSGTAVIVTDDYGNYRWEAVLDARTNPKTLDLRLAGSGAGDPRLVKALYAIRGDTLWVCTHVDDRTLRPANLLGKESFQCLQVFKRKMP